MKRRISTPTKTIWCALLLAISLGGGLIHPFNVAFAQWVPASKAQPNALRERKLALLIGVSRFSSALWSPLAYASNDVQKMASVLQKYGKFDRIIMRTSPRRTTKQSLLQAIQDLKTQVKVSLDTVVIYISSHGTISSPPGKELRQRYIITSDTTEKISQTALPVRALQRLLKTFRSRRIVLILATCYTYTPNSKSVRNPGLKGNSSASFPLKSRAMQILSAAAHSQPAFESSLLKSDVYTHFFTECAKKLALQKKQSITAIDIHVCALTPTREFVKKHKGTNQVPVVYSERGANIDVSLINTRKAPLTGYFRTSLLRDERKLYRIARLGAKATQTPIQSKAGELVALPPGRYKISLLDERGRAIQEQTIEIQQDQVTEWKGELVFELQTGGWFSQKGGESFLWGGMFGLHYGNFGLKLGMWSARKEYLTSAASQQLYLELRGEGGLRSKWGNVDFFVGGYAAVGLLLKHVSHPTQPTGAASVFGYGLTLAPAFWLHPSWAISLQADAGFAVLQLEELSHRFEASVRLGLYYRF